MSGEKKWNKRKYRFVFLLFCWLVWPAAGQLPKRRRWRTLRSRVLAMSRGLILSAQLALLMKSRVRWNFIIQHSRRWRRILIPVVHRFWQRTTNKWRHPKLSRVKFMMCIQVKMEKRLRRWYRTHQLPSTRELRSKSTRTKNGLRCVVWIMPITMTCLYFQMADRLTHWRLRRRMKWLSAGWMDKHFLLLSQGDTDISSRIILRILPAVRLRCRARQFSRSQRICFWLCRRGSSLLQWKMVIWWLKSR